MADVDAAPAREQKVESDDVSVVEADGNVKCMLVRICLTRLSLIPQLRRRRKASPNL